MPGIVEIILFLWKSWFSQEITISAKSVIFAETAILVISMETIEICYFGVKRTMPRPGMCVIIYIS